MKIQKKKFGRGGGCVWRSEAFVKIKKKNIIIFFFWGGGVGSGGGGFRVDGNGELKLL